MGFRYIFFFILVFNAKAAIIQFDCPDYCTCDILNDYRRATCQNKTLVTVEIGIPPVVELLDISHNHISNLENEVFTNMHLANLKLLNLSYNKISQINLHSFEGLDNLKSMDLSYNSIQYFLEQWFFDLRSLRELYLRANNLQQINNQPRINLPYLKVLDLSDNKIAHMHPIIFTSLPNLEILDISNNFLIELRVEIIRPLPNLRLLLAEGNNLECSDISFRFLRRYIKQNDITYVGPCRKRNKLKINTTKSPQHFERMVMSESTKRYNTHGRDDEDADENIDKQQDKNKVNGRVTKTWNQNRIKSTKSLVETLDNDDSDFDDNENGGIIQNENKGKGFTKSWSENEMPPSTNQVLHKSTKQSDVEEMDNDQLIVPKGSRNPKKQQTMPPKKNGWMVDDSETNQAAGVNTPIIKYVEVCNNKTMNQTNDVEDMFSNQLDKIVMKAVAISPAGAVVLSALFGVMVGMIVANTGTQGGDLKKRLDLLKDLVTKYQQKYFPNAKNPFKKSGDGNNDDEPKNGNTKIVPQEEINPNKSKKPRPKKDSLQLNIETDCSDCDDALTKFKPRPKNRGSPEQELLLDEEEPPRGSTPAMSKRAPSKIQQYSPRNSGSDLDETPTNNRTPSQRRQWSPTNYGSELDETLKPSGLPQGRGRGPKKSDESDEENRLKPPSRPGRPKGRRRKSDESEIEYIDDVKQRSRSGSPKDDRRTKLEGPENDKE